MSQNFNQLNLFGNTPQSYTGNGYTYIYDPKTNTIKAGLEYNGNYRPNFTMGRGEEPKYTGPRYGDDIKPTRGQWRSAGPKDVMQAELDRLFGKGSANGFQDFADQINNEKGKVWEKFNANKGGYADAFNKAKNIGGKVARYGLPFVDDTFDIVAGTNRIKRGINEGNLLDIGLGIGQGALGGLGMGISAAELIGTPFTGGGSLVGGQLAKTITKNAIKKLMKEELKRMGIKGAKASNKVLYTMAKKRMQQNAKILSNAYDKVHSWMRYPATGGFWLYDIIRDKHNAADASQDTNSNNEGNQNINGNMPPLGGLRFDEPLVDNPTKKIGITPVNVGDYAPIQAPSGPMETFIKKLVAENGINADNVDTEAPSKEQLEAKRDQVLRNEGYTDEQIAGFKDGTIQKPQDVQAIFDNVENLGNRNNQIREFIMGNQLAGNEQPTQEYQFNPEYMDKLLNYYDARKNLYNDYLADSKNLADNYMRNWWLNFQLKRGGNPVGDVPEINEALAKRNEYMKNYADLQAQMSGIPIKAIANYKMAKLAGLPDGGELADEAMLKANLDIRKNALDNRQKLYTELLKMQNDNDNKSKDRYMKVLEMGSQFEREQLRQTCENMRAQLTARLQLQRMQLDADIANGKIESAEKLRSSINYTLKLLKAADVFSYANSNGISDPLLVRSALDLLFPYLGTNLNIQPSTPANTAFMNNFVGGNQKTSADAKKLEEMFDKANQLTQDE